MFTIGGETAAHLQEAIAEISAAVFRQGLAEMLRVAALRLPHKMTN